MPKTFREEWKETRTAIDKLLENPTPANIVAAHQLFLEYHQHAKDLVQKETGEAWDSLVYDDNAGQSYRSRYYDFFHGQGEFRRRSENATRAEAGGVYDEGMHEHYAAEAKRHNKELDSLPGDYESRFEKYFNALFADYHKNNQAMMQGLDKTAEAHLKSEMERIKSDRKREEDLAREQRETQERKRQERERRQRKRTEDLKQAEQQLAKTEDPAIQTLCSTLIKNLVDVVVQQKQEVDKQGFFSFSSTGSQLKGNKKLLEDLQRCVDGKDEKYNKRNIQEKLNYLQHLIEKRVNAGAGTRTTTALNRCFNAIENTRGQLVQPALNAKERYRDSPHGFRS